MIFKIKRTSSGSTKPCEEAVPGLTPKWHTINYTEEYYNKHHANEKTGLWRERGTNHQVTKEGHITRLEGVEKCWNIQIDSLEQLIEFTEKYGKIVLTKDSIEIYDYYRE